jgi:hypothetical protein
VFLRRARVWRGHSWDPVLGARFTAVAHRALLARGGRGAATRSSGGLDDSWPLDVGGLAGVGGRGRRGVVGGGVGAHRALVRDDGKTANVAGRLGWLYVGATALSGKCLRTTLCTAGVCTFRVDSAVPAVAVFLALWALLGDGRPAGS